MKTGCGRKILVNLAFPSFYIRRNSSAGRQVTKLVRTRTRLRIQSPDFLLCTMLCTNFSLRISPSAINIRLEVRWIILPQDILLGFSLTSIHSLICIKHVALFLWTEKYYNFSKAFSGIPNMGDGCCQSMVIID